ncbi:hypothetical protein BKA67DRAFT_696969 [Truncatella angustata]|uniref:NACHT domain-containing protein n=1 Tax=Truncatella angustata TaxID=152316 RepID=A0A9P8UBB8_9PEZI|nr:uncharacterized protein BKA67DRAFT_696969 [Truncatella angustata]KAH6643304.1 hypothetical protein BKA67DRAFT_696969 [Truncatella angustata]
MMDVDIALLGESTYVPDFLESATRLYECVSHAGNSAQPHEGGTSANYLAANESLSRFVDEFSALISHLRVLPDNGLGRDCWKISQDVLIRLNKRPDDNDHDGASQCPDFSHGIQWTSQDSEAFAARITELCNRYKTANPDAIVDSHIETVLRLKQFNERQMQARHGMSDVVDQGKAPSQMTASADLLADFILESLSYKSMKNREEEVADAHGNTFAWIFKNKPDGNGNTNGGLGDQFTRWLRSDELGNIYWVTGKPGAGKSTLMRYIAEHPSTDLLLKAWAGKRQLAKAVFYFWTSGSEEQKSQSGLLRYLLYQLLSNDHSLIPTTFPELWQKLSQMSTKERIRFSVDWNAAELMKSLQQLVEYALKSTKICLFVDGLDEFDGDHQAIIQFFRNLSGNDTNGRLKLCLSSRPWPVFEKAFQYSVPNLKLEELTFYDMTRYVEDNLANDGKFKDAMAKDQPAANTLVSGIVKKAEGVFLWIRLVVRKVLELFGEDSDISSATRYSLELPSDLDEIFSQFIFQNRSPEQLERSLHVFQLVHAREVVARFIKDESSYSLSIWEFVFALQTLENGIERNDTFREVPDEEILQLCESALASILSDSSGLLEVYHKHDRINRFNSAHRRGHNNSRHSARQLAESRVTYLHRTVRDYLVGPKAVLLKSSSDAHLPHLQLLSSYVQRLRNSLEPLEKHRRLDELYPDIAMALTHARHMEGQIKNYPPEVQLLLIDQLDEGVSWYWQTRRGDPYDHWARSCFGSYEQRKGNKIIFREPFLALCTKFGLSGYVIGKLDAIAGRDKTADDGDESLSSVVEEAPLLTYALEFLTSRQKTIMPLSDASFVSALLQSPHLDHPEVGKIIGTPNMVFNSPLRKKKAVTPWIMVLSHLRDAKRRGWIEPFDIDQENGTKRWTGIIKLLVKEGHADLDAFLEWNGFDKECYARDVLVGPEHLGAVDDWWIHEFKKLIE